MDTCSMLLVFWLFLLLLFLLLLLFFGRLLSRLHHTTSPYSDDKDTRCMHNFNFDKLNEVYCGIEIRSHLVSSDRRRNFVKYRSL